MGQVGAAPAATSTGRRVNAHLARLPPLRRVLGALLVLQLVLGALLVASDVAGLDPFADAPQVRPVVTDPFRPGDQVRPFRPGAVPQRPDAPAPGPMAPAGPGDRLGFELVEHPTLGTTLHLRGPIAPGDRHRFATELEDATVRVATLALHSPGGSVADAIAIGELVRERGLRTVVAAEAACVSACPWILAGGTERLVSRRAWVGVHQMYFVEGVTLTPAAAVADVQSAQSEAIAVLVRMGVDARIGIPAMATPPERMYFLVEEELIDYALATTMID